MINLEKVSHIEVYNASTKYAYLLAWIDGGNSVTIASIPYETDFQSVVPVARQLAFHITGLAGGNMIITQDDVEKWIRDIKDGQQ